MCFDFWDKKSPELAKLRGLGKSNQCWLFLVFFPENGATAQLISTNTGVAM